MHASPIAFAAAVLALAVACAQPSQSTTVTAPTASPPTSVAAPTPAAPPTPSASPAAGDAHPQALPDAEAPAPEGVGAAGPGDADAGAAPQFRTCALDSDCVAVDRAGCCHNGWKEAVAVSQKDSYAKSFTCPQAHPICPMYIVNDPRVAECDNATHMCTMVKPEDVACGGFIRNKHSCPAGYKCEKPKHPDVAGKCVHP